MKCKYLRTPKHSTCMLFKPQTANDNEINNVCFNASVGCGLNVCFVIKKQCIWIKVIRWMLMGQHKYVMNPMLSIDISLHISSILFSSIIQYILCSEPFVLYETIDCQTTSLNSKVQFTKYLACCFNRTFLSINMAWKSIQSISFNSDC